MAIAYAQINAAWQSIVLWHDADLVELAVTGKPWQPMKVPVYVAEVETVQDGFSSSTGFNTVTGSAAFLGIVKFWSSSIPFAFAERQIPIPNTKIERIFFIKLSV